MARKYELGLKYFSHDTDMAYDRNIRKVTKRFGAFGYGVNCRILEMIYKNGHYIEYDDEFIFDVIDSLNMESDDDELIKDIIAFSVSVGLYDSNLFENEKVLTSHGIQTRYFMAKEQSLLYSKTKNNTPDYKYLLVDINEIVSKEQNSFTNNENCFENNPIVSETMQQIKVNKILLLNNNNNDKKSEDKSSPKNKTIDERKDSFKTTLEPYIEKYGKDMLNEFFVYWTEPNRSNTKMRFELEKTWSVSGRLSTWYRNNQKRINKNGTVRNDSTTDIIEGLKAISSSRR